MSSTIWNAQPDSLAVAAQCVEGLFRRPGVDRAHAHRRRDQRTGFRSMNIVQMRRIDPLALGLEVGDLPADHPVEGSRGRRQLTEHADPPRGVAPRVRRCIGEDLERQRKQGITGQDRHGLAELLVTGRPPASVVVIVERRQIVVNQRVRMDQFQRAGEPFDSRRLPGGGFRGRDTENRSDALAAGEQAVAHRAVDRFRIAVLRRQSLLESGVDPSALVREIAVEGHAPDSSSFRENGSASILPSFSSRISTLDSASWSCLRQDVLNLTPFSKRASDFSKGRSPPSS